MGYVVDASCALKLVLDDGGSPAYRVWYRNRLEENALLMSSTLLPHEVGNVLVKRLRLDAPDLAQALVRIVGRTRLVEPDPHQAMRHALGGLSYDDAGYLAIAQATGDTLVTADKRLARAAQEAGAAVRLF